MTQAWSRRGWEEAVLLIGTGKSEEEQVWGRRMTSAFFEVLELICY